MSNSELQKLIDKYLAGTATSQEKEQLDEFYTSRKSQASPLSPMNSEELFKIKDNIRSKVWETVRKDKQQRRLQTMKVWFAAAATIVLIATFVFLLPQQESPAQINWITRQVPFGEKLNLTLPDGSQVKLNAGSEISFPEKFSDGKREVRLTGEAFFEVVHNPKKPFTVAAGEVMTTVLGTSFNVKAEAHENVWITLASGKVAVSQGEDSVELSPGEQAVFDIRNRTLVSASVDLNTYLAWTKGIMEFEGASLRSVTAELEKWFGVSISYNTSQMDSCSLRMTFNNKSLQEIMDQLALVAEVEYEFIHTDEIKIFGAGCSN